MREQRKTWLQTFAGLATAGLWAAALALLVVATLPWLAGLPWPAATRAWLTVVENLRLPVGLTAAAVACCALLLRRGRVTVAACFAVALSGVPVVASIPGRQPVADDAPSLTVMTFNIWVLNREPERLVAYLREQKPDIVFLEEVTEAHKQALAQLADLYPTQVTCHHSLVACETMLLSRFPAARQSAGPIGGAMPSTAIAELQIGSRRLTAIAVHVAWPFPMGGQDAQREQVTHLAAARARFQGPLLVGGDFNGGAWVRNQRDLRVETGLSGEPGLHPTWPARPIHGYEVPDWIRLPIDHVLSRGGPVVVSAEAGPELGSDHLPLLTSVAWPR
jgi:endonuclease/exonuclease/phosphatase (EEP) superfamily protein YafD